ncbi:MAG TPA: hypothetical protein VEC12_15315, partial [Bacteroidia bacterium]|nr:hypothetical protein [Bacteroidia bacterium]
MKKNLLIAMVLMGISAKAQFFQRTYGPGTDNRLTHGYNTNAVGLGHFMVGNTFTTFGTMPLVAVRTDVNGTPNPVPNFTSIYQINDGTNNLFAGRARSFEIPGGTGFGILVEISGATDGLAYLTLDPSGNVTNIMRHFPVAAGYRVQLAHVVVNDLTNTDAIAVGTMINTNVSPAEEYPFAYSFDIATGNTINWSNYYDHFNGFSPSINVSVYDCALAPGTGLLGVVGKANTGGFTVGDDAFYMALDITTGGWMGPSVINDWVSNEDLRAIHYSAALGLFATCGSFDFF